MPKEKIRNLLGQHGHITRSYFKPERTESYEARLQRKGTPRRRFVEAWFEFADKNKARAVANRLNGNRMGGKRVDNPWYDELWSLTYLPDFTWDDLEGYQALKQTVKRARIDAEIKAIKDQTQNYIENLAERQRRKSERRQAPHHHRMSREPENPIAPGAEDRTRAENRTAGPGAEAKERAVGCADAPPTEAGKSGSRSTEEAPRKKKSRTREHRP